MSDNYANEISSEDGEGRTLLYSRTSGNLAPIWLGLKNLSTQEHFIKVCVLAPHLFDIDVFEMPTSVIDLSVSIFDLDESLEEKMQLVERMWLLAIDMMRKPDKLTKALNYYNETLLMFSDGCVEHFVDHFIEFCSFESELNQLWKEEQRCFLLVFCYYMEQVHQVLVLKEDQSDFCGFGRLKKDSTNKLERGLEQHKHGEYEAAMKFYEIGLEKSPLNHELYLNRAKSYLKLNKFESVIHDCQRCILLKPEDPNGYRYCAKAYCGLNEARKAINVLISGLDSVLDEKGSKTLEALRHRLEANAVENSRPLSEIVEEFDSPSEAEDEDYDEKSSVEEVLKAEEDEDRDEEIIKAEEDEDHNKEVVKADEDEDHDEEIIKAEEDEDHNEEVVKADEDEDHNEEIIKTIEHYQADLENNLVQGSKAFVKNSFRTAVNDYTLAVILLETNSLKYPIDKHAILLYCLGLAHTNAGMLKDIKEGEKVFNSIISDFEETYHVLGHLGLAKSFIKQNRYLEAVHSLEKGLELVTRGAHPEDDLALMPGTTDRINDIEPLDQLKKTLADLLSECRNPPEPAAVCRYEQCEENAQIYPTDPEFRGYVQVTCLDKCCAEFHRDCWKKLKAESRDKLSDKELLGTSCVTPDCHSLIAKIKTIGNDGLVLRELSMNNHQLEAKTKKSGVKGKQTSLPPKTVQAQKKGKKSKSELKGNEENNEATSSANENKIKALVRMDSREDSPSLEVENYDNSSNANDPMVDLLRTDYVAIHRKKKEDEDDNLSKRNKKKKEKPKVITLKELSDILPLEETDAPTQRHSNFGLVQYQLNPNCEYWAVPMIKGTAELSAVVRNSTAADKLDISDDEASKPSVKQQKLKPVTQKQPENKANLMKHFEQLLEKGPCHQDDELMQKELEALSPVAQEIVRQSGGISKLLLQSVKFAVIGGFICLMRDAAEARLMSTQRHQKKLNGGGKVSSTPADQNARNMGATKNSSETISSSVLRSAFDSSNTITSKSAASTNNPNAVYVDNESSGPSFSSARDLNPNKEALQQQRSAMQSNQQSQSALQPSQLQTALQANQPSKLEALQCNQQLTTAKQSSNFKPIGNSTVKEDNVSVIEKFKKQVREAALEKKQKEDRLNQGEKPEMSSSWSGLDPITPTNVFNGSKISAIDPPVSEICPTTNKFELLSLDDSTEHSGHDIKKNDKTQLVKSSNLNPKVSLFSAASNLPIKSSLSVTAKDFNYPHSLDAYNTVTDVSYGAISSAQFDRFDTAEVNSKTTDSLLMSKVSMLDDNFDNLFNGSFSPAHSRAEKYGLSLAAVKVDKSVNTEGQFPFHLDWVHVISERDDLRKQVEAFKRTLAEKNMRHAHEMEILNRSVQTLKEEHQALLESQIYQLKSNFEKEIKLLREDLNYAKTSLESSKNLVSVTDNLLAQTKRSLEIEQAERRSLQEQYEKVVSQLKNSRMDVQRREFELGDNSLPTLNPYPMYSVGLPLQQAMRTASLDAVSTSHGWPSSVEPNVSDRTLLNSTSSSSSAYFTGGRRLSIVAPPTAVAPPRLPIVAPPTAVAPPRLPIVAPPIAVAPPDNSARPFFARDDPPTSALVPTSTTSGKQKTSFDKVVTNLMTMFPNLSSTEVIRFVQEVRMSRGNTLSGLTMQEIISRVRELILEEQLQGPLDGSNTKISMQLSTFDQSPAQSIVSGTVSPPKSVIGRAVGPPQSTFGRKVIPPQTKKSKVVPAAASFQDEPEACIICHEELDAQPVTRLDCGHVYHTECVRKWFKEQSTCPTCRNHALLADDFPTLGLYDRR